MAGTENKGVDYAVKSLFEGAKWVLTPSKWSNNEGMETLKEIINILGATTIIADPYDHDKAVALISHMPLLLSQALYGLIYNYKDKKIGELALNLAASGFRDTTRLAATNPELAKDMLSGNKQNIYESVEDFKFYLDFMQNNLDSNQNEFFKLLEEIASNRGKMYSLEGKNILYK